MVTLEALTDFQANAIPQQKQEKKMREAIGPRQELS
jgi:hypothetical protein